MELIFSINEEKKYQTTFEAVSDFALHIEKPAGDIRFYQSSVLGATPQMIGTLQYNPELTVIDVTCVDAVYPKEITIISNVEPTMAVVTFPADVQTAIDESIVAALNEPV